MRYSTSHAYAVHRNGDRASDANVRGRTSWVCCVAAFVSVAAGAPIALITSHSTAEAASNAEMVEYPVTAQSDPYGVAQGADGNVWFTESNRNSIGFVVPSTGTVTELPVPTPFPSTIALAPQGITAGPPADSNSVWFAEYLGNAIDRVDLTTHAIARNTIPLASGTGCFTGYQLTAWPNGVAVGPDGNLWFTGQCNSLIEVMTTAGSVVAQYTAPASGTLQYLTAGPDGNVWFTQGGSVGVVCLAVTPVCPTVGAVNSFAVGRGVSGITVGPDHALWFADTYGGELGEITTAGAVTMHPLTPRAQPYGIAMGPDGNLWFTDQGEFSGGWVGVVTTDGVVHEVQTPTAGVTPVLLTGASDGGIWLADQPSGIARLDVTATNAHFLSATPGSAVSVAEGQAVSPALGSFNDADGNTDPSVYTATIDWRDGVSSGTVAASGTGSFLVTGSHTYDEGTYLVVVQVVDSDASAVSFTVPVTVSDQPLAATFVPGTLRGKTFRNGVLATFTDPSPESLSNYSATIDWGDGTPSTAGTVASTGGTGFSVSGGHTYRRRGTHTLTVTVVDGGGSLVTVTGTIAP